MSIKLPSDSLLGDGELQRIAAIAAAVAKEKKAARNRKWRALNKERAKQYFRDWYDRSKPRLAQVRRAYYLGVEKPRRQAAAQSRSGDQVAA